MDVKAWEALVAGWPTDWIIIAALVAFISLDALRAGSARAASLVLSLPAAMLVVSSIPEAFFVGPLIVGISAPIGKLVLYVVIFGALYFSVHRTIFSYSNGGGVIQALVAGITAMIVLLVVWMQVPELNSLWQFGPQVQAVFGPTFRFWWLFAAFMGISISRS